MDRILQIEQELNTLSDIREKFDKTWDYNRELSEYLNAIEPITSGMERLDREKRMLMVPEFSELSDDVNVMSLEEFIENVKDGGFIDYDGSGNYMRDGRESNITIYPSDVEHGSIRKDFDQIAWYNR